MNSLTGLFCSQKSFTLQSAEARGNAVHGGAFFSSQTVYFWGRETSPGLYFSIYEHHEQNTALSVAHSALILALYGKGLCVIAGLYHLAWCEED